MNDEPLELSPSPPLTLTCGPMRLMTEDETSVMLGMILGAAPDEPFFTKQVLEGRLLMVPENVVSPEVIFMAAFLASGNPGCAVVWAWTLIKENINTMDDFVNTFPMGVPTDDAFKACWNSQKVDGCNLLDKAATWQQV